MNAVSMDNLWAYLQGLALTANNRQWLAEKLVSVKEPISRTKSDGKIHIGNVKLPTDKFVGKYDFSEEDEDRMRWEYLSEKYQLDWKK